MDTILHGVQGALFRYAIIPNKYYAIGGAIEGMLPDLIGALEKLIKSDKLFFKRLSDNRYWKWYSIFHAPPYWPRSLWLGCGSPPFLFHILLDLLCHSEDKRWWKWKERLWLEILLWIVTLILCYLTLKWR